MKNVQIENLSNTYTIRRLTDARCAVAVRMDAAQ